MLDRSESNISLFERAKLTPEKDAKEDFHKVPKKTMKRLLKRILGEVFTDFFSF